MVVSFETSKLSQFATLSQRAWCQTLRDPGVMYVRTAAAVGIALLVGSVCLIFVFS